MQLTLLAPGSVHPDPPRFTNGQTTASSGRPYVNGNREQANNFILDGMDNNQVSDNLVGYAPSVDAIQEFNEITQNAPAEFGNFMGGIISTHDQSRAATHFHGDAVRVFPQRRVERQQLVEQLQGCSAAKLRWNEFGGTFGGPIKRDKLFFFVDYQGQRYDTPTSTGATSVFTAQERQGNFSALLPGDAVVQPFSSRERAAPAVPGQHHSGQSAGSGGAEDPELLGVSAPDAAPGLINNYLYSVAHARSTAIRATPRSTGTRRRRIACSAASRAA